MFSIPLESVGGHVCSVVWIVTPAHLKRLQRNHTDVGSHLQESS